MKISRPIRTQVRNRRTRGKKKWSWLSVRRVRPDQTEIIPAKILVRTKKKGRRICLMLFGLDSFTRRKEHSTG